MLLVAARRRVWRGRAGGASRREHRIADLLHNLHQFQIRMFPVNRLIPAWTDHKAFHSGREASVTRMNKEHLGLPGSHSVEGDLQLLLAIIAGKIIDVAEN